MLASKQGAESFVKLTVEPSRVSHETESVTNVVVNVLRAAPYRRDDDDFTLLQQQL